MLRAFDISQRPKFPVVPAHEVALQLAIRALRCLCSIAKGLQAPLDIDTDDDESDVESSFQAFGAIHADIVVGFSLSTFLCNKMSMSSLLT
jgi:hypothetical protein